MKSTYSEKVGKDIYFYLWPIFETGDDLCDLNQNKQTKIPTDFRERRLIARFHRLFLFKLDFAINTLRHRHRKILTI